MICIHIRCRLGSFRLIYSLKTLEVKDIVEDSSFHLLSELARLLEHRDLFNQLEQTQLQVKDVNNVSHYSLKMQCEAKGVLLDVVE
ncbi:hypothetical protein BDV25DRAFT_154683 [Aspergillus avenaceus]|uniref:Uncharacterized protein n=1 Tax=Aspergillus avenaceus TaxID=36643 RepID=A0A5N6TV79_ASPAV|nr:hypothetical protein BDV25DRAFT_154683 [Aspergillus avenaceus]